MISKFNKVVDRYKQSKEIVNYQQVGDKKKGFYYSKFRQKVQESSYPNYRHESKHTYGRPYLMHSHTPRGVKKESTRTETLGIWHPTDAKRF